MSGQQPYLYQPMGSQDARFPQKPFDPKAITRASFEPQQPRPKQDGPLISFNRHPDAHLVLTHRSNDYQPLSPRMKGWIKGLRVLQLSLRALQLVGAMGVLALYILMTNVATAATWILRIAPGIAMLHCAYGIYHLSRRAGGRTPASSAAYQLFSAVSDLCVLPIYAFGVYVARLNGSGWGNLFDDKSLMQYFVPAAEYTALGAGALHLVSLCLSIWLGVMFRRIALMPPDLNPLEDRFTSRVRHKRNKSSIATTSTGESEKSFSSSPAERRRSGMPQQDLSRPPTIPFMRTRANSGSSYNSRDSRGDLPSRQYQIVPGNASPRASVVSTDLKRLSGLPPSHRSSYGELPLGEAGATNVSRPSSGLESSGARGQQRVAKFTETWSTTDSLISRTQQRQRMMQPTSQGQNRHENPYRSYEALGQRYDAGDGADSDSDHDDHNLAGSDFENDISVGLHPQPLRSNPLRVKTPYHPGRKSTLCEVSVNSRQSSGTYDIADEKHATPSAPVPPPHRATSIQRESEFFSKPYGQLKPATPPIMVGSNRQASSGNDYEGKVSSTFGRRNVSGKVVEEGRADHRYSRYRVLNE